MIFIVYAIKSESSGKIYIGQTNDLTKRLRRHNGDLPNKSTSFTSKNHGPWKVIYQEKYDERPQAIRREKELKSFRGREFLKQCPVSSAGRAVAS